MSEPGESAYDRGHLQGEIAARLAGHDKHFGAINGSLERIAANQVAQTLAIQRLADQAEAEAATRIATAKVLKDAADARKDADDEGRKRSEQAWSPIQKLISVVAAVASVVAIYAVFFRK
jgi:hypothetical protein